MAHEFNIDFFDEIIRIEDPTLAEQWVDALKPECKRFAEQHYRLTWEPGGYVELSKESMTKLSEAVCSAIAEYRQADEPGDHVPLEIWKGYLSKAIGESFHDLFDDDDQCNALHEYNFDNLFESLDEAMGDFDGPTCDAEEVYEMLKEYTLELMYELDTSDPTDYFRQNQVEFTYIPGLSNDTASRSDHMLNIDIIEENGPDENMDIALKLFRIDSKSMIERFGVDYTNEECMARWDKIAGLKFEHPPIISAEKFDKMMNECGNYALPMWFGRMSMGSLMNVDFKKSVKLTGGVIGLHDSINGQGYMEAMEDDAYIVLEPTEAFSTQEGYSVDNTYGFYGRSYDAHLKIMDQEQPAPKPTAKPERELESPEP